MRAITLVPGRADSAELTELPDPRPGPGELLVERSCSECAAPTARSSRASTARPRTATSGWCSATSLLARVLSAPEGSGFAVGDPVAAIVRRPDPVPCDVLRPGEWDMCRNGLYTERGIKGRDGYGAER